MIINITFLLGLETNTHKDIPPKTKGVYVFASVWNPKILYVGKSNDIRTRIWQYINYNSMPSNKKLSQIVHQLKSDDIMIGYIPTDDNANLEHTLINKLKPEYNTRAKEAKTIYKNVEYVAPNEDKDPFLKVN